MKCDFSSLATTDYGNVLDRKNFIDHSVHPLWHGIKPISGPAYTVQLAPGDNLMLHSAIYQAPSGSIIVVDGVDTQYAVAGGNVCAVAKERGIKGFIIDGVIRDLAEITDMEFPVYAKGVFPVPGEKRQYFALAQTILCGGVYVSTGDIIIADIEGIAVIPKAQAFHVYQRAKIKSKADNGIKFSDWKSNHKAKIEQALRSAKK